VSELKKEKTVLYSKHEERDVNREICGGAEKE
jgi:hypothetical protein